MLESCYTVSIMGIHESLSSFDATKAGAIVGDVMGTLKYQQSRDCADTYPVIPAMEEQVVAHLKKKNGPSGIVEMMVGFHAAMSLIIEMGLLEGVQPTLPNPDQS
jgi:hypothetical protein